MDGPGQIGGAGDNPNHWQFDPANSYSPFLEPILRGLTETTMAEDPGYVILREAVSKEHVLKVEEDTNTHKPVTSDERVVVYSTTPSVDKLVDDFMKTHVVQLSAFIASNPVPSERSLTLGIFRQKVPNTRPKITRNQVFITFALTPLNKKTGWYTILKGSHLLPRTTPEDKWDRINESLNPGDAIIWRGDVALCETAGGGGKFITVGLTV